MSQCQRQFAEGPAGEPDLLQTRAAASAGAAGLGREGASLLQQCYQDGGSGQIFAS